MLSAIIFFFIGYLILLILFIVGWQKALNYGINRSAKVEHFISVIIPFRNEEKIIDHLLDDLVKQDYKNFEVILVDDHSDDNGDEKIRQLINQNKKFTLIKNLGSGKKLAITNGVNHAMGDIILTTDADCRVSAKWLSSVNLSFQEEKIKMVFGPVKIDKGNTFFSKLQAIEFASLIGSGAATYGLGFPSLCNGANLAFKKNVFEEVGGYHDNLDIPSGDDEFLMRKIVAHYPDGLLFLNQSHAIVSTKASGTLSDFLQQRLRWAGKWRYASTFRVNPIAWWASKFLAVFILLFHVSAIASVGFLLMGNHKLVIASLWLLKLLLEFLFLYSVSLFLQIPWSTAAFLLLQILYSWYVVLVGVCSNFFSYNWKGRRSFAKSSLWVGNNN